MFFSRTVIVTLITPRNPFIKFNKRLVTTLSPLQITELLSKNEISLHGDRLPNYIGSIQCNQLASNSPIEDRLRVSSITVPGSSGPTLMLGVFDGHGGGTTADIIHRRLFNYIALSLHPKPNEVKIGDKAHILDLHNSPEQKDMHLQANEFEMLTRFKNELSTSANITAKLKESFNRCDDDLSQEIQENLTDPERSQSSFHYYLSAAVSGCCALVMVIHEGMTYLASAGDCRAVLGIRENKNDTHDGLKEKTLTQDAKYKYSAIDLNDEHNCDNINEIRRLTSSHPSSEQNTMIKYNRLLGHLMPFRAFGDFNYKWNTDVIKACGITRVFGPNVIPSNYKTPPYLIAEPDVTEISLMDNDRAQSQRCIVLASDGLWELFESSRDVIEAVVDHSSKSSQEGFIAEDYDRNCATHVLRSALRSGPQQYGTMDAEELRKLYHVRLESTLTLPQAVVRNFRDDISIVVINLW